MKSYPVLYRSVCFVCILMVLSLTFESAPAEISDSAQAIIDAKTDAKEPFGWLAGSFLASGLCCLTGPFVILASQVTTPTPPAQRFLGKSSEYVDVYTNTYQSEVRKKRLIHTSAGCLVGAGINIAIFIPLQFMSVFSTTWW